MALLTCLIGVLGHLWGALALLHMATHSPVRYAIFPTWQPQDSGEESQGENCKTSSMSRLWN